MQTTIKGIVAEMVEGDDGTTNCHLSAMRDKYTGSLALAQSLGGLEDEDGNLYPVDDATLSRIEAWAVRNGY